MLNARKRKLYPANNLVLAVNTVRSRKLNVSEASREYGVPRKTIDDHVNGLIDDFRKPGPSPMLTFEEETSLVKYMSYMAQHGFPLTRSITRTFVVSIMKKSARPSLFNLEKGPSDKWFRKFMGRHPELQERHAERQERSRSRMSNQGVMDQYFHLLDDTLTRLNLKDKPSQLFNTDESGFSGKEMSREKVTTSKGHHSYQQQVTISDHVTVNMCISADGRVLPSMVIFNKCLPHRNYNEGVPSDWLFAVSETGYIDANLFKEWFVQIFLPNCGRERPVLLIMDNHDSHVRLDVIEIAIQNNIELLCLPPHTTHILQPLDVSIFGPLKAKFTGMASKLGFVNSHMIIGKARFPFVLSHSIDQCCSPARVKESFRKTGIVPFNPEAIDKSQLVPASFPPQSSSSVPSDNPSIAVESCQTCGNFLTNPLVTAGLIPASLGSILVPPKASAPKRKSKAVMSARVVTGAEMVRSLKEKEDVEKEKVESKNRRKIERERKRAENERRKKDQQERRREREERQAEQRREKERKRIEKQEERRRKDEIRKQAASVTEKKRRERALERQRRKRVMGETVDCLGEESDGSESGHETVCKKCGLRDPTESCVNGAIDWTTCEVCEEWFHVVCASAESFVCVECSVED